MRILIVQDTDWIRRNPIQHTHLAERLALRGHEIRVIDYEILWRDEGKKELLSNRQVFYISRIHEGVNIPVIRPRILKVPLLDYASMLLTYKNEINQQIKEFKPDVIIGNDILTPLLTYRAAKRNGIKTIFYAIDIEHRLIPFKLLQPLGKYIEAKNIKDADLVIAINEGLREYTIRMGAERNKTLVIRAGIDPKRFDPGLNGEKIRKRYGISSNDKVLLFVGWIYDFSGLREVVLELSKIKDERPNIKLLIVGDGDGFAEIKGLVDDHDLRDRVILTGRQPYDDIPLFIASVDVCLLPAYNNEIMRDIVPIKFYDYMSMNKPVVTTKLPGVIKEFGEGNGVIYVDKPEDVLWKAIELVEGGYAKVEGSKAGKFVEPLSWNNITDEFEEVLKGLI